jgi:hypothetical protein
MLIGLLHLSLSRLRMLQLLDAAEVIDGDDDEPEDVTLSPRKMKRRRKPLPATYEPGTLTLAYFRRPDPRIINKYCRQADVRMAETEERLC